MTPETRKCDKHDAAHVIIIFSFKGAWCLMSSEFFNAQETFQGIFEYNYCLENDFTLNSTKNKREI